MVDQEKTTYTGQCERIAFLSILILLFAQSPSVFAQSGKADSPKAEEQTAGEEQSKPQAPGAQSGGQFSLAAGAGVIVSPRPYVGADSRIIPIPSIELDYKRVSRTIAFSNSGGFMASNSAIPKLSIERRMKASRKP